MRTKDPGLDDFCLPRPDTASDTAEDLAGYSGLLFLTALPDRARILFLLAASETRVSLRPIGLARFQRVPVRSWSQLPYQDGSFDLAVLDADAAPRGASSLDVLDELGRVLTASGTCLLVTAHRCVPERWTSLRSYRLFPTDRTWLRAIHGARSFRSHQALLAQVTEGRLEEVLDVQPLPTTNSDARSRQSRPTGNRRVHVLHCSSAPSTPAASSCLTAVLDRARAALPHTHWTLDGGLIIRRIGKTAIFANDGAGARYLVRMPRTPLALERARRNYVALERLQSSQMLPQQVKYLVPRPAGHGRYRDLFYFVETVLDGRPIEPPRLAQGGAAAVDFIVQLHRHTRVVRHVDVALFDHYCGGPIRHVRSWCHDPALVDVFARIELLVQDSLGDRMLPFVASHGDFALGNCLFDASAALTGVIDWELALESDLPLLDLLHAVHVPGERSDHPRWQRFDFLCNLMVKGEILDVPVLRHYAVTMELPQASLPGLLMMYWVDHVAKRIAGRAHDSRWLRKRVHEPLRTLRQVVTVSRLAVSRPGH